VLFAVTVDNPTGTNVIRNSVIIRSAEFPGGGADDVTTLVVTPAPVPLLSTEGFAALGLLLTGVAWVGLRRGQEA
jgi:hypothetical protein